MNLGVNEMCNVAHAFELAGLGKAPFRVTGVTENVFVAHPGAPARAGGCCDFCGTGIRYEFWIKSSDGKAFKVGCDCVKKTGDKGLVKVVSEWEAAQRKAKKEKKRDEANATRLNLHTWWNENRLSDKVAHLKNEPHPNIAGRSLWDYVDFAASNGPFDFYFGRLAQATIAAEVLADQLCRSSS